ncbi:MAG TPA: Crp/Fnr family transcriptional regulator [Croceibacterium sp.]|jgi:CRP/FNR family transcriptional regulator
MTSCDTCAVRSRAICAALGPLELGALNSIGRRRTLRAGEPLIWEGDDSILVANVIAGVLKLSTGTADGREQIVGVVYPADFIGRPFGSTTHHAVTALTDARVCVFTRADFDRFAGEHPALEHMLLQRTLAELDRTRGWMLLLARKSAEEKVATFVLDMSARLAEPGSVPLARFDLPFSRQQIGDVLGLTIETVSRQMTKLKRDGVIDLPTRRAVAILERAELQAIAG